MSAPANRPPSIDRLPGDALWPAARVGEAICAVARASGLAATVSEGDLLAADLGAEEASAWIEAEAARCGLQADQVFASLEEVESLLTNAHPAIVRLSALPGAPFLAIARSSKRRLHVVGPDGGMHAVPRLVIASIIQRPFEAGISADVESIVANLHLPARQQARARKVMMADRLKPARFRGCWTVRLPAGADVRSQLREVGLPRRIATLSAAYVLQYGLFVVSWWLLGRGVLQGRIDRGWLLGWLLLLLSLIPLRLLATWTQGLAAVSIGSWLRRRVLRGAFQIDRQQIRHKGAGQLFGLVMEAAAIDSLALSGGLVAAFAAVELLVACLVLVAGGGVLPALLLAAWSILTLALELRYFNRRRSWTVERLAMSEQLLEAMVGHRTRLVQQPPTAQHIEEDESLAQYIDRSGAMDREGQWLTAFIPRGWLAVALAALTPSIVTGAAVANIAVSIGGILLAYRALQRLCSGLTNLTSAAIAWQAVTPLVQAAKSTERPPRPSFVVRGHTPDRASTETRVVAREIDFRYRTQGEPILRGCNLTIGSRSRIVLEGPSGSGKTTFGSILAGLTRPDSGLLLIEGLDRSVLGAQGWHSRVLMAPQAHDNYIVGGTLAFNLLMGRRWPAERSDLEEAEEVCRELGLGDLLDRLPSGLHQLVGETGWQLSQGERARVFLARALLQKPDLLVLDESFGALDAENVERAVRCVNKRAPGVLAIAHP